MSDPVNPYAQQPPFGQDPYAQQQPGYGQQAPYAQQPGYGQQAPFAQQPGYGQSPYGESAYGPVYGQPSYAPPNMYQYESIRSNSTIVIILACLSFLTFGLLMSIPAWLWGQSLVSNARDINAPQDVVDKARMGRMIAMIIALLQLAGVALFIFFLILGLIQ